MAFSSGFDISYLNTPPSSLPWNSITALIDFAVIPNSDGTVNTTAPAGTTPQEMAADIAAAHQRGKKAMIAIGAAGVSTWSGACTSANRAKFAANIVSLVRQFGYDGVDLDIEQDWGYPNYTDLTACVQVIHNALKAYSANQILTNDTDPTWMAYMTSHIAPYVDYLQFMSYWQPVSQMPSLVANYTSLGIPASKLVIGLGTDPSDPTMTDHTAAACTAKTQFAVNGGEAGVMNWFVTNSTPCTDAIAAHVR
jgi:chitinase